MIKRIEKEQLPICLDIMRKGYEDSAVNFGMTEENCPYRGRTRLPLHILEKEFSDGYLMYSYTHENKIIGFLSVQLKEAEMYIQDIVILPDYQDNGYGNELFLFAKEKAKSLNCKKIMLGMVHDNIPLRQWYSKRGFKTVELINFDTVEYTVGIMELIC